MGTGVGWAKTQHKSGWVKKCCHKEEYEREGGKRGRQLRFVTAGLPIIVKLLPLVC